MSLLQKAVWRGQEDLALPAAATLLVDAPDRLWRRIGCMAFDEIARRTSTVGFVTVTPAGKRMRAMFGDEGAVRGLIVAESDPKR